MFLVWNDFLPFLSSFQSLTTTQAKAEFAAFYGDARHLCVAGEFRRDSKHAARVLCKLVKGFRLQHYKIIFWCPTVEFCRRNYRFEGDDGIWGEFLYLHAKQWNYSL
jgi:hypothetical protein